jgi:hypothetical protein
MSLGGRGGGSNEARRDEMPVYASIKCRSSDHLPAAVPARRTIATAMMMIPPPMPQNGSSSIAELPSYSPASRTEPKPTRRKTPVGREHGRTREDWTCKKAWAAPACAPCLIQEHDSVPLLGQSAAAAVADCCSRKVRQAQEFEAGQVPPSFVDASSRGRPEYSIQGRARSLVPLRKATSRPRAGNISDRW